KVSKNAERAPEAQAHGDSLRNDRQQIVDLDFLRGLIAAVDESGIDSLEVSRGGTKIRIAKTAPPQPYGGMIQAAAAAPAPAAPAPAPEAPRAAAPAAAEAAPAPAAKSNLVEIKSPMVGT